MPQTTETVLEPALTTAPPDKPAYKPFPELSRAVRSQTDRILAEWRATTLMSLPEVGELPVKEFQDDIARILAAMADALESNDPPDLQRLMNIAPAHGFQRFLQQYDLSDLFTEERVLRRVIISQVESALKRQCKPDEAAALHAMIDIMLQQGVLALVQAQRQDLRSATELQLKYLSFLSHDLSNNFLVITMNLEHLSRQLDHSPGMNSSVKVIDATLATIKSTRAGMRRLLEHERLRKSGATFDASSVNLCSIVQPIVTLASADARAQNIRFDVDIDSGAAANTDASLVTIILQNLVGNAVKFTAQDANRPGQRTIRIEAQPQHDRGKDFWRLSIVDDGPGIPQEQLDRLFGAFEQMPRPGESTFEQDGGFGLGLAIASQAARLLGTTIQVQTELGRGSRFSLRLPAAPR